MRQSNLLIFNTFVTYGRMFLTVVIGLVVTRMLFQILHAEDFGLLTLLGGTIWFMASLTEALAPSAQRHLAYEIGRDDRQNLRKVFSTSLCLFICVALVFWLFGTVIAGWLVPLLELPPGREGGSLWSGPSALHVFELTLITIAMTILTTVFQAMLHAHQAMVIIAAVELLRRFGALAGVALLWSMAGGPQTTRDPLVDWVLILLYLHSLANGLMVLICLMKYPASRPSLRDFHWAQLRRISGFAGWEFISKMSWQLRMHGGNFLLNLFFGLDVNAAYGITRRASGYHVNLGGAISQVTQPAMTSIHARGQHGRVRALIFLAGKYPVLIMLLYLIPAEVETEYLLFLWLGVDVVLPPHTVLFVQLVLAWVTVGVLSQGFHQVMLARGVLGRYTLLMTVPVVVSLVVAVICFVFGVGPWILPATALFFVTLQVLLRAWYVGRLVDVRIREWFAKTVVPVLLVAATGFVVVLPIRALVDVGWLRFTLIMLANMLIVVGMSWCFALESRERDHFKHFAAIAARHLGISLRSSKT